jgi:SAM-dependent methyltransferase
MSRGSGFGIRDSGFGVRDTRWSRIALAALLIVPLFVHAQTRGRHPVSGRVYAGVMSAEGAAWLERPERQAEENPQLAIQLLALPAGAVAADIGCGSGYITELLSNAVGPTGRVYGVDIQPKMLELLRARMATKQLTNVTPVLSAIDDPKLPDDTLDLAIMVDVYHEFSEPQTMLQRLRRALKADGRLVLLEYRKEDPTIPILADHKMSVAEAKLEVEHEGFTLADVNESLPRQHILIFTKR